MTDHEHIEEHIAAEAADWVVRLQDGDADEAAWLELTDWLEADDRHRQAYDQAEMLWRELDADRAGLLNRLSPGLATAEVIPLSSRRRPVLDWRAWSLAGAAAAAALAVLTVTPMLMPPAVTYATAPGQRRDIVLSDGSRVTLNGRSRITVRITGSSRRVTMSDAEAVFDVRHDPARPFLVTVGESQVRDLGTTFNIRRDGASTRVTVAAGTVEVSDIGAARATPVRLTAGQSLERDDASNQVRLVPIDPQSALAWRTGQLVYDDRPLSEVADDLGRAFGGTFTLDPDVRGLRFTGVLILDNQDAVLRRLQAFLPVTAARETTEVRLKHR